MKIKKITQNFAQVPNEVSNCKKLSWKAKGIFLYIQSKPDDWDFNSIRMSQDSTDGRDGTRSGIKELIEQGFLLPHRNKDGTMDYECFIPQTEKASDGKAVRRESRPLSNKEELTKKEYKQISYAVPSETAKGGQNKHPLRNPNELLPGMTELVDELDRDKRRHIGIIALYLDYRKKFLAPKLKTRGQLNQFIRRHSRAASSLTVYDDGQIQDAFKQVERKYKDIDWSLETVLKELTK